MPLLVSIIIPVYNSEKYLSETIQSALNQTWENKEIIIVDDGSTDNSLSIAKSYESEIVKIYAQENKGASAARNKGLKEAKGDYIQFLDADDLLDIDKVEKQLNLIKNDSDSISFCENINFDKNGPYSAPINLDVKHITDPFELLLHIYGGYDNPSMITVHSWLVPREIIDKVGFWNENLSLDDDGEFFCRVVLGSKKAVFCKDIYSYYRKHKEGSLSSQKDIKHLRSEFLSIKLKTALMLETKDTLEVRKAMAFWNLRIAIIAYPKHKSLTSDALSEIKYLDVKPKLPVMGGKLIELIKKNIGWKFVRLLQTLKSS